MTEKYTIMILLSSEIKEKERSYLASAPAANPDGTSKKGDDMTVGEVKLDIEKAFLGKEGIVAISITGNVPNMYISIWHQKPMLLSLQLEIAKRAEPYRVKFIPTAK
jgi:hypothetical protein